MQNLLNIESNKILKDLGVIDWGYTESSQPISFQQYKNWLGRNHQGKLTYLTGDRGEKRSDIKNVFPEFQSALVFLFEYQSEKKWLKERKDHRIAGYALGFGGNDYHFVLRERLEKIKKYFKINITSKFSIDMEPILERDLAYRSGLGWFGKNSMLIHSKEGSYFLIASILLSEKLNLAQRALETDHCGSCNRCIEACPTDAITENRHLIADRCISTFTIETFKEESAPDGFKGEYYFGCDICQDVCPWNNKPLEGVIPKVSKKLIYDYFLQRENEEILNDLAQMSNRTYKKMFKGTALERPGRIGMIKNLKAIKKRSKDDNSNIGNK